MLALVLLAVLGSAYWYFIGLAPFTVSVNESMPEEMDVLRQGTFNQVDSVHKGSGTAKIVQSGDKYFLVLENFKVTNGPDLYVALSKNKAITDTKSAGEYKLIQPLKGNVGNQVYEITKEDAENYSSTIIWCERFGVLFSAAELQ